MAISLSKPRKLSTVRSLNTFFLFFSFWNIYKMYIQPFNDITCSKQTFFYPFMFLSSVSSVWIILKVLSSSSEILFSTQSILLLKVSIIFFISLIEIFSPKLVCFLFFNSIQFVSLIDFLIPLTYLYFPCISLEEKIGGNCLIHFPPSLDPLHPNQWPMSIHPSQLCKHHQN